MTTFADYYHHLKEFTEDLFLHPELGYKEHRTSNKVIEELKRINPQIEYSKFSETGVKTFYLRIRKKHWALLQSLMLFMRQHIFKQMLKQGQRTTVVILLKLQLLSLCMIISLRLNHITSWISIYALFLYLRKSIWTWIFARSFERPARFSF